MDNHEPYSDELGHAGLPSSFSSDSASPDSSPSRDRMTPMSIGDSYNTNSIYDPMSATRKTILASIVAVVFLLIGFVLKEEGRSGDTPVVLPDGTDRGHQFGLSGSGSTSSTHELSGPCQQFDLSYFNDLLWRVESMNETDPDLCIKDFQFHPCQCLHPLRPSKQTIHPGWMKVVAMNVALMKQNYSRFPPDVVIYGDSITEHLVGRNYGHSSSDFAETALVTQQLMTKGGGGHINALPMGVSADLIANLLYRLRSGGEMPESLHPQVWWVMMGTGDLGMGCSVESVVAGNIGIVKEIRERHNNQHGHKTLTPVVINSIFPRGHLNLLGEQTPWQTIRQVNQQLECFASLTEGVHFVNATDVFVMTNATGTFINDTLVMPDHLHPSAEGNRQWEELIVSNVMELMI